ncbi:hypothetical protein A4G26_09035 [Mycobacterium kansasii]|nr:MULTISPECIES: hypothetical protein [Mycobacterium]KZS66545.1 hypothetical protein A4G26_09035 [Mycobacterium kansasii]
MSADNPGRKQLITDRMDHPDNRWSLTDVVHRMQSAGYRGIGKSRLGQVRNGPVESIKRDVIFALAAGLGVTPLTVANAALESMGISTRPAEVTDSAATITIDPTLSEPNRRQLLAMLREMRRIAEEYNERTRHASLKISCGCR